MVAVGALLLCAPVGALAKNDTQGALPPGQAQKPAAAQPPGQARKAARAQPPGQARKAATARPPGQARKVARPAAAAPRPARTRARPRARAATTRSAAPAARRATRAATVAARRVATAPAGAAAARTTGATPASHRVATQARPRAKSKQNAGPVRVVTRQVTRTVRDIAHVIPAWAKALMAALACLLAVAAALILFGVLRSRRLRAQRERLAADVGALQAALLPVVPDEVGPLAVSVAYRPADGLAAGGDFYDVFALEAGRVGILVGDVSGHGRDSLRAATFTRHMVRAYLEAGLTAREALRVAGHVVDQHRADDDFATLVAAVYDPAAGTLSYSSAGHPPPIVLGPAAHNPMIAASAPPLGVDSTTGLRQTIVPLPAGSTVVLFTDGLFEARKGGTTFGRARLTRLVTELGSQTTAAEVVARVEQETDSIHDDVAVCVIRVAADAVAAGTVRVEELEVAPEELDAPRVRRFLAACAVRPAQTERILKAARARASADGAVLLRVRLARDRSGVDVLPADLSGEAAAVTRLAPTAAVEH